MLLLLLLLMVMLLLLLHSVPETRERRISVEVLNVSLAVVLKELVVKVLPDIELAWRVGKPLLLLLAMIASMALSQSPLFLLLHPVVVVVAHVVVVVVVDADGAGGEGLGMSQHQLLPSHWLGRLLLQFAIFWHITDQGSTSELLRCQHPTLLSLSQGMMI